MIMIINSSCKIWLFWYKQKEKKIFNNNNSSWPFEEFQLWMFKMWLFDDLKIIISIIDYESNERTYKEILHDLLIF
jgi:hypothetical protein